MKLGFFTRKIGPLPAWAWAGVAALAVLVARHFLGGKTTGAAGGTDLGAAAAAGNAQDGYGAFGGGSGDAGGLPTDQGLADPGLGGPGTTTVFDPTGGPSDGVGPGPLQIPYDGPDGVAPPVVRTKQTTPGNAQGSRPKHPRRGPPPGPEEVSEHGKGQTQTKHSRPKHSRGQRAKHPRVRGTGRAPTLVSEHGKGQASVPVARRAQQSATQAAVAPARAPAAAHPDAGARPAASPASPVGTTTSTKTYERMGRKLELD